MLKRLVQNVEWQRRIFSSRERRHWVQCRGAVAHLRGTHHGVLWRGTGYVAHRRGPRAVGNNSAPVEAHGPGAGLGWGFGTK